MANQKPNNKKDQSGKVKAYQEINDEIAKNDKLKQKQPTPQPQDFEEIEY
ncbi:hypothetical protein ACFQ3N_17420 [Virgibacillus byunsanensis]|uniref:Glycogen biosynthesis protein GlgD n=1 Tax=Virgibacillus byunsanensis TaxID=570945 RepID=A0ABW3LP14_9BACI